MGTSPELHTRNITSTPACVGASIQVVQPKQQRSRCPRALAAPAPQRWCEKVGATIPLGPRHGTLANARHAHGRHHARQICAECVSPGSSPQNLHRSKGRPCFGSPENSARSGGHNCETGSGYVQNTDPFLTVFQSKGDGCVAMVSLPRWASAAGPEVASAESR